MTASQKIIVFEQNASGESKIQGIKTYGENRFQVERFSIDEPLPPIIEDATSYFPDDIQSDLVLDYLKHPDLSYDLAAICSAKSIPVIASGKKHRGKGIYTPPT